jgi:hypothetical protein
MKSLAIALLATGMAGCAHVQTPGGGQRVVGLVWMDVPSPAQRAAGESLRVYTLGLSVTQSAPGSAVTLGVSDASFTVINADSCAVLPKLAHRSSP